jgi:hypothetical protein
MEIKDCILMAQRGHEPIEIPKFGGLYDQGDVEEVPLNHFSDCENITFHGDQGFKSRVGIGPHQDVAVPIANIRRIYNYVTDTANTLLVLSYDGTTGYIYHVVDETTVYLILTKTGMEDFAFQPFGGRAYISPFKTYTVGTLEYEKGLQSEYLYVYAGDGTAARTAGVTAPVGTLVAANGAAGYTDAGTHLFGVVYETTSGALSAPAAFVEFSTSSTSSVSFSSIPVSGDSAVVSRHIVATRVIDDFNGNTTGYVYYFIPGATVADNVTTVLANQSFYDADLIDDASHLLDNFAQIPAGAALWMYHNRLCLATPYTDISIMYVSAVGEPEAFNQIDGLIEVPADGNPITNGAELRDVMYVMKRNRTYSYVDNEDEPGTWPLSNVDAAYGAPVHGIGTVIDSGSNSVDQLLVASARGIVVFGGRYMLPELTWKIDNFWLTQDKTEFRRIQIVNDAINQIIYITLPDTRLLIGDYTNGFDPQNIRWAVWRFDVTVNTIALVNVNELIIGAELNRPE